MNRDLMKRAVRRSICEAIANIAGEMLETGKVSNEGRVTAHSIRVLKVITTADSNWLGGICPTGVLIKCRSQKSIFDRHKVRRRQQKLQGGECQRWK